MVYVTAGGGPNKDIKHQVFYYSISTDQWNQLPPPGCCFGSLQMVGDKLAMFGGRDSVTNEIATRF